MRFIAIIRVLVILFTLLTTWYVSETFFATKWDLKTLRSLIDKAPEELVAKKKPHNKCGNEKACPSDYFAFKIISGAANVVGPSLCFEDTILMSSVKNNIGRGLNIAVVNAFNGKLVNTGHFDMYSGSVDELLKFLEPIEDGSLVFLASYDDPGTKLNDKAREIFTSFGSSFAKKVGFRDGWVFLGGKGLQTKTPFEQHIKNDKENNKYDGWPEVIEMEGCVPKKVE
ncbi:protein FAM3D [Discoglossus pictus]